MKQLYTIILVIYGCFSAFAQTYIKPFVGGNFSSRIFKSEYPARHDSLNKTDKIKLFPTAGVQFLFEKNSGKEFMIGIGYSEMGFKRERLDYQFLDTVHPDLGPIYDLSQAAQKNAYFTYRYNYLEVPIGMNLQFTPRQYNHIFTGWFNVAVIPQLLLKEHMTIFLQGFSMKGKTDYDFKNTGFNAAKFNASLQSGGRFDFAINKRTWVTADALFRMHLLSTASNNIEKFRLWNFSVNLGIRYEISRN